MSRLKIGSKTPHFSLLGTDKKEYSLKSFADKKLLILIVSCNHCPYAVAYEDRMISIQSKFAKKQVQVIAINGNNSKTHPADSFANMQTRAHDKSFNFPYLHDETQDLLKTLGARFTPEVFLFNEDRQLVYTGRIDDCYDDAQAVTDDTLINALEASLKGNTIAPQETSAIGCSIKW